MTSPETLQEHRSPDPEVPRVWLVIGDKLGDNAQARLLAQAVGWPYEEKRLVLHERYVVGKPWMTASLHHIDRDRSDPLAPPWPDLVITIGRRPSMVALWIRRQSGGQTRTVILGLPRRLLSHFDLVVTAPHYRSLERPNVARLDLPLLQANPEAVAQAAAAQGPRFADLPRPLTALFVGGPTRPARLDAAAASDLIRQAAGIAGADGGTLYVTTSRRTPPEVADVLEAGLPPGGALYRWAAGREDNPYLALLGLADRFIVTGDSISMLVEVARVGKPLAIFPLSPPDELIDRFFSVFWRHLLPDGGARPNRALLWLGRQLEDIGLAKNARDLAALHETLIERGMAVWLGEAFRQPRQAAFEDIRPVAERIRSLVQSG